MEVDDELCLCFHVTKRKVINFVRIEKPKRVAQMSDCFGAGTGCGWCRPYLKRLFEQAGQGEPREVDLPSRQDYAQMRTRYVQEGKGTPPPGATAIDPDEQE